MTVYTFTFNHFGENTYLLIDDSGSAAIVDPGCLFDEEKQAVLAFLEQHNLSLKMILFTHCHLDHAFGANFIHEQFPGIPVYGHEAETIFITDYERQAARFGLTMEQPPMITNFLADEQTVSIGNSTLVALHVPGHSPGSICYYSKADAFVIAGDVLFANSIGRTDLLGGNHQQLIASIHAQLMHLPGNTTVYPGHGPTTTIGAEKQTNPFLR